MEKSRRDIECWYSDTCNKPNRCNEECLRYSSMKDLCSKSHIPESKWFLPPLIPGPDRSSYEKLDLIRQNIFNWVTDGNDLYIYSKYFGNGKTTWAIKLMLSYFDSIWHCSGFNCRGLFINSSDFLMRRKNMITNYDKEFADILEIVDKVDLVIWDDIATTKLSDYDHQLFYNSINNRMFQGKSNIFTGNVDSKTMNYCLGNRLTSRIWNSSEVIQFVGTDKRGLKL